MKAWWQSFGMMLTFLTRIPLPQTREFNEALFLRGRFFFPIIGGIIGLCLGLVSLLIGLFSPSITAFLIIVTYLLLVGGLHIDGLGDLFDGIFSARTREKMFTIMEDSHVGAFGVIGLILYFLGMYTGLSEILLWPMGLRLTVIIAMPIVSRSIVLFVMGFCRYAKLSGMGKGLIEATKSWQGVLVFTFATVILGMVNMTIALAAIITAVILLGIGKRIEVILNGLTGDVVGAVVEISHVVFLIVCIGLY